MADEDQKPETDAVVVTDTPPAEEAPASVPTGLESTETAIDNGQPITWTASEFIAHHKSVGWYLILVLAAAAIGAVLYLLTRDVVTVLVVAGAALMLGIYGSRQPRQLEYKLDHSGLQIGDKHYTYSDFRTFSVIAEDAVSSIQLMPLKRFAAPLSVYYPPEDEEKITSLLNEVLPYEEAKLDAVDRLAHRIRF